MSNFRQYFGVVPAGTSFADLVPGAVLKGIWYELLSWDLTQRRQLAWTQSRSPSFWTSRARHRSDSIGICDRRLSA
jgi:hypothetical protein